ncbi:MAG: rhamnan synthesis F family protein [Clostridia bacterium]|nr:rhamnan synthesis F family protein [Clostridia bacterium]
MKETIYVKFSNERNKNYRIKTEIVIDNGVKYVEKSAIDRAAEKHIINMTENYNKLKNCYNSNILLNKSTVFGKKAIFEFIEGDTLAKCLDRLISENKSDNAIDNIIKYFNAVTDVKPIVKFKKTDSFVKVFGDVDFDREYDACPLSNIDIVFDNVILNNGYNLIDYEWTFDFPVPIKFLKYRAICNYIYINSKRNIILEKGIFNKLDIDAYEVELFNKMEVNFQNYVTRNSFVTRKFYNKLDVSNYFAVDWVLKNEVNGNKYAAEIYIDKGEGIKPFVKLNNVNKDSRGEIDIELPGNTMLVRIDPVTDVCIIGDVDIKAYRRNLEYRPEFTVNGYKYSENTYVFKNEDTQFNINTDDNTTRIKMTYAVVSTDYSVINDIINGIETERVAKTNLERNLNERQSVIEGLNETIRKYDSELKTSLDAQRKQEVEISEKSGVINEQKRQIESKTAEINYIEGILKNRERQIEEIYNSTCWKITSPLRFAAGGAKKFLRNSALTKKPYEFLYFVKKDGLKNAVNMYKKQDSVKSEVPSGNLYTIDKNEIVPLKTLDKKIAVHLHLYYVDLLEEFFVYFNKIPYNFDLYVSCKSGSNIVEITKKFKKLKCVKKVDVRETINRGRDIAPLYVQFAPEIEKYDYFLHVHSKKSLFTGKEQYGWRQFSLDCLLKDEDTIRKIFALFESDKKIGLFYPETFGEMHLIAQDWLANAYNGRKLLNEMGIEFDDGLFNYPVGSFFWAKMDAVKSIFDRKLRYEDFPEEAGQTDGTIAHALERAISFVTRSRGYVEAIHDINSKYISIGKSYRVYQDYFNLDYEAVQYHLSQFDLVSFDIFDTLITRCVYSPYDIFEIMRIKIKNEFSIDCDFTALRKKAEAIAWEEKKEFTSINDIYGKLPDVMGISAETAQRIKNMEVDLEFNLCIPREDMLKIFNHIKSCGKKIVLVSDMYLTSDIIGRMLNKCGFVDYDDIWVSCEKGKRKDNDTIWEDFFKVYGQFNTIHVGDNPRSDIQIVGDKLKRTFFVINPRTAFKMSKYYDKLKPYINGSVADKLMLGMFINGGIYNSPFCQGSDGEPVIKDYDKMGYSAFGPLFSAFSLWLNKETKVNDVLMFLAREGYILEQVYKNVFNSNKNSMRKSCYFLASRRAVSVAAIRSTEDIKSVLSQFYRGTLENLLLSRLGVSLFKGMDDREISMPEDIAFVMESLSPHFDKIFAKAETERNNYIEYIKSVGIDNNGVIVDVGYSGTIQYYMAKLIQNNQKGLYLCTWVNKKPEKLGCPCYAMYPVLKAEDEKKHIIFKNQLFLEAVLKAPFGQLICFDKSNGKIQAMYKSDNIIGSELNELQNGILKFSQDFGNGAGELINGFEINSELAAALFDICLEGGWISDRVGNIMTVQDDYCKNGSHRFNAKTKTWEVVNQ